MAKIRVFTLNKNGKIELTKEELQQMLDESYRDGSNSVTITTPSYPYNPVTPFYYCNTDTNAISTETVKLTNAGGDTTDRINQCDNNSVY